MGATQKLSSFNCEIRIIEAKNIGFKSPKNLFVRYYLSTDPNKKIRLNTTQVSSISHFVWNQSFCLECLGSQESLQALQQATVVFELRRAKTRAVFGSSSQLLGRAEIPWSDVFESQNMEIERWVSMVCGNKNGCVYKQPKLKVGMRVRVPEEMEMVDKKIKRIRKWKDECGCCESSKVGDFCGDFELFALTAAMEFL
ncbi:uncharacterized protein LOC105435926 [Cucumis sativus]|uniref:C2 domain-containing protein n=1 Tax=Cucumis sativus TaxID=3659 RepID=A0A0A0KK37_CUCSA|nr:uncharacterized protein LOC105435926 [Cucumis sativus]KGN48752.1 hypothetical protein Csa_003996 [Cucumis sativus]